ncbi:DNA polymerase [Phyllobacterium sp. YR620]|uniref:UdgX family uracil-DNA binding protein n=1 Tax=Phyllobacterium sp. YR620 TaxID=1881066 RepID=UPI0008910D22|nr:UdgX family uracil-DNA binding protein [Phyllobacterium sp. YR620]SDP87965.1 DNA polymerase [Phyllobacterium sp. YR620]
MRSVILEGRGDFIEWRDAARRLLSHGIEPNDVMWSDAAGASDMLGLSIPDAGEAANGSHAVTATERFIDLAETVICHSSPARFGLLYRILSRMQSDKSLLNMASDEDVAAALKLEKSVRRDRHKMKAFVRFKEVVHQEARARRQFVAWFEPDHFIVERVAPFFQRRFTDMDWIIATPRGSMMWDGQNLVTSREPAEKSTASDATDDLWRTYYASIFNPARLKLKAMRAEMPKKYWKNLPEAVLIPELVGNAERSVMEMRQRQPTLPPLFHDRLQEATTLRISGEHETPVPGSLDELGSEARRCTRCPLHCNATQTVFGEGPADARIMFVGEQPGDQEDLAGRPFVGPAGKVFDKALAEVGIDRRNVYVTNAVKHFKYVPRGKRRIHQKPNAGEIEACKWWLRQEIDLVKPQLVVALGATALASLTGRQGRLTDVRGVLMPLDGTRSLLATVHPSYLLRLPDLERQHLEIKRFHADLRLLAEAQGA